MRILFAFLLALSLSSPLFTVKNNNAAENAIDYMKNRLLDGNWGMIAKEVIEISENAFKQEKDSEKGGLAKISNSILTGYGIGYSAIGAVFVSWNNYRFDRFDIVPILPIFVIITTIFQMFFHNYFYRNRNAILSIVNMLLVLSIYGNCIGHEFYSGYLYGIFPILIIQISYMIYFYWFPYKRPINAYDENQPS